MDGMWLVFYWTGPIGIGVFLASLGVLIWLLSKANDINKRTKAMEKQLEKEEGVTLSRESGLSKIVKGSRE